MRSLHRSPCGSVLPLESVEERCVGWDTAGHYSCGGLGYGPVVHVDISPYRGLATFD